MVIKVTNKDLYDAEEVFSSLNDHTWLTRALERIGLQDGLRRRARSIQKKRLKDHLTFVRTKQRMHLDLVRSILPEGTPEEVVKQRARGGGRLPPWSRLRRKMTSRTSTRVSQHITGETRIEPAEIFSRWLVSLHFNTYERLATTPQ